jgi:hypothetical protein
MPPLLAKPMIAAITPATSEDQSSIFKIIIIIMGISKAKVKKRKKKTLTLYTL